MHSGNSFNNSQEQPQPNIIGNNKNEMTDDNENVPLPKKVKKSKKHEASIANVINAVDAAVAPSNRKKNKKNQNKLAKQQQQAQELTLAKQQKQDLNKSSIDNKNEAAAGADNKSNNIILNTVNKTDNTVLVVKSKGSTTGGNQSTLVTEIAKAREHIKNSLEKMDGIATLASSSVSAEVMDRISVLEKNNADMKKLVDMLQKRIATLEIDIKNTVNTVKPVETSAAKVTDADDDDVDLFGSDEDEEESAEAAALREKRLAAYAEKKSKKPTLIAKSSLVLDIKPWDDETDMKLMETEIRKITADGLLWGASKFLPVAYGIQKISISCVVEDDKISIDWLTEEIEKIEDYVQSVDVAAFNKI